MRWLANIRVVVFPRAAILGRVGDSATAKTRREVVAGDVVVWVRVDAVARLLRGGGEEVPGTPAADVLIGYADFPGDGVFGSRVEGTDRGGIPDPAGSCDAGGVGEVGGDEFSVVLMEDMKNGHGEVVAVDEGDVVKRLVLVFSTEVGDFAKSSWGESLHMKLGCDY